MLEYWRIRSMLSITPLVEPRISKEPNERGPAAKAARLMLTLTTLETGNVI